FHHNKDVLHQDLICKIHELLERNWWVEIGLIQRTANGVADTMTKKAAAQGLPHAEWLSPWNDILPALRQDSSAP
ncbi:hypothetical protein PIB30_048837, partial [Stylosanthes scabra]|nr:hypothetical protein [Stylosanthes scabra]